MHSESADLQQGQKPTFLLYAAAQLKPSHLRMNLYGNILSFSWEINKEWKLSHKHYMFTGSNFLEYCSALLSDKIHTNAVDAIEVCLLLIRQ